MTMLRSPRYVARFLAKRNLTKPALAGSWAFRRAVEKTAKVVVIGMERRR